MRIRQLSHIVLLLLTLLAPIASRAADILQEVPNDALGFVVVHDLSAVDSKVRTLSSGLRNNAFSPLGFLKTVAGVQIGLRGGGDALLVVYPDARGDKTHLQFAVWLPVTNYANFLKSLGSNSADRVAVVTVAGEDLLVAHRGEWAVMMDPDQRERMMGLIASDTSGPQRIATWNKWIYGNDVTIVAFESGVHQLVSWAEEAADDGNRANANSDDLFGRDERAARRRSIVSRGNRVSPGAMAAVLTEFHTWTAASPAIAQAIQQANMVGCGIRLDATGDSSGNMLASLRVGLDDTPGAENGGARGELPFGMYKSGPFVIAGAGRLPQPVLVPLASAYLQRIAAEMKTDERTELDSASLKQLSDAIKLAAADVRSAAILTQPGAQPQPPYTNNFIALRASSASEFLGHAAEVMRLWNKANREAHGDTRFVFDVAETKLGDRAATQYSLDFAAMIGTTPAVPEVRQAMERLFGPGGKLRYWTVQADASTVLLANGTAEQVIAMLKTLDSKQPVSWERSELSDCNRLLRADADWRLFFNAHEYFDWQGRAAMAQIGVPVIGGPLVRPFPPCPPVGIAGGFRDHEMWIDVAALAPTVKSAYSFFANMRTRPEVRRRLQPATRKIN